MLGKGKSRAWITAVALMSAFIGTARATVVATLQSVDRIVGQSGSGGPALGYYPDDNFNIVGRTGSGTDDSRNDNNVVLGYVLPTLSIGQSITGATFHFEITAARAHTTRQPALDVYLLNTSNPDATGTGFFYQAPSDPSANVEYINSTYIAVGATEVFFSDDEQDQAYVLSGDALALLQSFYGGDHTPDQAEAFFRFNLDVPVLSPSTGVSYDRYRVDLASDESWLDIETIPEPATLGMLGIAGLALLARRRLNG